MRKKNAISRDNDIRKSIFLKPRLFEEITKIQTEEDTFFLDVIDYLLELGLRKYYEGVEHLRGYSPNDKYDDNYLYEDD